MNIFLMVIIGSAIATGGVMLTLMIILWFLDRKKN